MQLNKIRIILNDNNTINMDYSDLSIVINQYATNYKLEVAYLNDMAKTMKMKIVFNIKGSSQPAKILSPTLERIKLQDNPEKYSYYSHEFKFTQYETQFYQDNLMATLYIYDESEEEISNVNLTLSMAKSLYNKVTPVDLENNSSIESVVTGIYALEDSITKNFYTKAEIDALIQIINTRLNGGE